MNEPWYIRLLSWWAFPIVAGTISGTFIGWLISWLTIGRIHWWTPVAAFGGSLIGWALAKAVLR